MQDVCINKSSSLKIVIKRLALTLIIPCINIIYAVLNNYRGAEVIFKTILDDNVPFCKIFVVPYIGWYLYVAIFLIFLAIFDKKNYYKLLMSLIIGMITCYTVFYFFPTYVPRPNIYGDDILTKMVLFIYKTDNPYNCFPSIHVLNSLLVQFYVNKSKIFKVNTKIISNISSILIILSTIFIKQHFITDIIGATIVACCVYFLIDKIKISKSLP